MRERKMVYQQKKMKPNETMSKAGLIHTPVACHSVTDTCFVLLHPVEPRFVCETPIVFDKYRLFALEIWAKYI
jgi:hypothetical protein